MLIDETHLVGGSATLKLKSNGRVQFLTAGAAGGGDRVQQPADAIGEFLGNLPETDDG